jgi:hypothetical protein
MNLILSAALGLVLFSAFTQPYLLAKMDNPESVARVRAEIDQYRTFMFVATQYMSTYTSGAATIPWTTLQTLPEAPSGMKNLSMPTNWRVVIASTGIWVACTPMTDRALAVVQQIATESSLSLNLTTVSGSTMAVVGDTTDTSKASLCG